MRVNGKPFLRRLNGWSGWTEKRLKWRSEDISREKQKKM
jgi:hypothetical protein